MRKDLTGKKFGRLTVLKYHATISRRAMWECECECGKRSIVRGGHLIAGATKSCGCLGKENASKAKIKHGDTIGEHSRLYGVWQNMKNRCNNTNLKGYKDYGGRGITVCDEWLNSYSSFKEWAVANGYDDSAPRGKCTIDRIDNDGNYEPSNCRFVDSFVQVSNQRPRKTRRVEQMTIEGDHIGYWKDCKEAGEQPGMGRHAISAACRGHRKTAYGFRWRYV
jgi:hypothetical protein